jgi:hypothetical protein
MPIKKRVTKKKATTTKSTGGIAAFNRKVARHPAVASKTKRIKSLETQLKALKKEKAKTVKGVRAKYKK